MPNIYTGSYSNFSISKWNIFQDRIFEFRINAQFGFQIRLSQFNFFPCSKERYKRDFQVEFRAKSLRQ